MMLIIVFVRKRFRFRFRPFSFPVQDVLDKEVSMEKIAPSSVTLKDIAERTGFSLVSVHRAINGKSGVSEKTRREILAAAQRMGYTPNLMASALKRKQLNVAIVFPQPGGSGAFYFDYMWKGCRAFIEESTGYQINYIDCPFVMDPGSMHEEEHQLEVLSDLLETMGDELDGLLTVPMANTDAGHETIARFAQKGVKVLLIDNDFSESGRICCISASDENTGRLGAELMCAMLHQQTGTILIAAGNEQSSSHQMNAKGFADYLRTHRPELSVICVNDPQHPTSDVFYPHMEDPSVIAAYSVRARNTIPLCEAALKLETQARRKLLVIGSDLFSKSADMLRRGVLKGIIYKNPYQKGYTGLKTLVDCLIKDAPPKAPKITVPISVIMRSNLVFFEEFL